MNFSRGKRGCIAGLWLLGLASCASAPQSQAPAPNAILQPITEGISQSALELPPDSLRRIAPSKSDIWSQLQQADTHYYVQVSSGEMVVMQINDQNEPEVVELQHYNPSLPL